MSGERRVVEAVAAAGVAPTTIVLRAPGEFVPGPKGAKEEAERITRDAAALWDALRRGLPVATLVELREHFRTWRNL